MALLRSQSSQRNQKQKSNLSTHAGGSSWIMGINLPFNKQIMNWRCWRVNDYDLNQVSNGHFDKNCCCFF